MQLDKAIWLEFTEKNANVNLIPVIFAINVVFLDSWLSITYILPQYLPKINIQASEQCVVDQKTDLPHSKKL